jgi:non-specific serine/threonine protein kinase
MDAEAEPAEWAPGGAPEAFGGVLRRHRRAAGLTQEALAERAGLGVRTIQGLEEGEAQPRRETVRRLAAALAVAGAGWDRFEAAARPARRPPKRALRLVHPAAPTSIVGPSTRGAGTRGAGTRPPGLPLQLTSFVGRRRELGEVRARLLEPGVRLLTLTGPGGVGKTRLALQAASALDGYPDGAWFVPLAALGDPALLAVAVAGVLGVRETGQRPLSGALATFLRNRRLLLVLDNVEHLLPGVPVIADLLASCPGLTVLATSRAALRLAGEHQLAVPPLSLPEPGRSPTPDGLLQYEAPALFVQRAVAARADFAVTADTAPAVAELCRRLDGLPLAIELAAARVTLLPPPALLARLDRRLAVLTSGPRDAPVRQQTLRATLDWSHALLAPSEQVLFRRLAVFAGGCTPAAAEAVCNVDGDLGSAVLDGMAALVDSSLLQQGTPAIPPAGAERRDAGQASRRDRPDGELEGPPDLDEPRFVMLATLREYGLEQLEASGEAQAIRRRHAQLFLRVVEDAEPHLMGAARGRWVARLETEYDNLRAALSWLLVDGDAQTSVRMATALVPFWSERGHLSEGRGWLQRTLAASGTSLPAPVRAKALSGAGTLAMLQIDTPAARALLEQSLALWRALRNAQGTADVLSRLAHAVHLGGDIAAMVALGEESLALYRQLDDRRGMAGALGQLGHAAWHRQELASARALLAEALALLQELEHGQPGQGGQASWNPFLSRTHVLWTLGTVARDQGDYAAARASYAQAMAAAQEQGSAFHVAVLLDSFASLAAAAGQAERAARLLGAAEAVRQASDVALAPVYRQDFYDAIVATVQAALDGETLAAAWAEGRAMSWEQASAYGLAGATGVGASPALPSGGVRPGAGDAAAPPARLTGREVEILRLVAGGKSNPAIAEELVLSVHTVERHVANVYAKIGVHTRAGATAYALRRGLA